jgi:hypothetical protein
MKFLKSFLPNLTIVLSIALVILLYLDNRNPMMGFLYGKPFMLLGASLAICSVSVSIMYYVSWQKEKSSRKISAGKFEKGAKQSRRQDFASVEDELSQV